MGSDLLTLAPSMGLGSIFDIRHTLVSSKEAKSQQDTITSVVKSPLMLNMCRVRVRSPPGTCPPALP